MISVVIPSFNRASTLPRALASVLLQKLEYDDFEILLIDDGSSDETCELVTQGYQNVTYLYQHNQGVSAARNLGIKKAKGEWIAFLDSDDEWLPDKLATQLKILEERQLKVCHTEEIWVRNGVRVNQMNKHKKHGGWIYENCLPLCVMSPSSIVIHRSIFDDVGNFDEALPACEDYDLWLRICARYEVCFIDTPLLKKYGGHNDQLSRQYWGMDRFRVKALEKMLDSASLDSEQVAITKAIMIKKCRILLNGALKHGNTSLAEECRVKLALYG